MVSPFWWIFTPATPFSHTFLSDIHQFLIYRVGFFFFFDDPFLTSSCRRNSEDIDLRFFLQIVEEEWYFFYMQHVVIYSLFFLEIENLKKDQFYKKMHSSVNIDHVFF